MENIEKRRIRFPVASIFYFFVSLIFVFNLVTILSVDLVEGIGRYIAAGIINTVSAFLISGVLFAKNRSVLLGIAFFLPLISDIISLDFLGIISSLVMLGYTVLCLLPQMERERANIRKLWFVPGLVAAITGIGGYLNIFFIFIRQGMSLEEIMDIGILRNNLFGLAALAISSAAVFLVGHWLAYPYRREYFDRQMEE
ncbi:MAG: hypothetical protein E7487_10555 [Ruminococcaceae bacterium]|nr:hypothetical protein [Oscillospiraceae bacterium]